MSTKTPVPSRSDDTMITMSLEQYVDLRFAPWEEWRAGNDRLVEDRRQDVNRRLEGLNGEAGRLKTVLDASVPQQVFNNYVSTQRDKDDERERTTRERFERYASTQAASFKLYSDDVTTRLASINVRIATFVGGGIAFLTLLQLYLNWSGK
jgi:hypothetical protein